MTWKPAPPRSLSAAERNDAPRITAQKQEGSFGIDQPQVLHGVLASSALGRSRGGMTDRKLETGWSEKRDAAGWGEFLVMTGSDDVSVEGFELVIKPTAERAAGAAPKSFFIAGRKDVFAVDMPQDAWQEEPGTRYTIKLPKAVKSDCFAVVLGDGYVSEENHHVTIAELRATSAFDGDKLEQLVAALDDDRAADAARALLVRSGDAGAKAAMAGYAGLNEQGKSRALTVIEGGACGVIAPFFVDRVIGIDAPSSFDPDLDRTAKHARERLRLCKGAAAEQLSLRVREGEAAQRRVWAAREMAAILPAQAIDVILDVLDQGSTAPKQSGNKDDVRRGLRAALGAATKHKRAAQAVAARLEPAAFGKLSLVKQIDLLRAIGEQLPKFPSSEAALTRLTKPDATFRTRYLLQEPAAHMAREQNAGATRFLQQSLSDTSSRHLRAQAARVAGRIAALAPHLDTALGDDSPRVREAALIALTEGDAAHGQESSVVSLLSDDPWTFVRIAAATNLAVRTPTAAADRALVDVAKNKEAPTRLRATSLRSLGKRKSRDTAEDVRAVANNAKESIPIRTAAISALGKMCDPNAAELLFKLALRAGYQQLPYDQPLGLAALKALGDLKPPGLHKQLAPLFVKNKIVPPQIRSIAKNTLDRKGHCR